jgi:hypothetical protein
MIIHSYLTDGFFPWAKLYLKSFKLYHGENIPIILCTRDLSNQQMEELYSLYSNVNIKNENIDIEAVSKSWGLPIKKVLKYKNQIEKVHITPESRIWKQFTSADQRIRSIYNSMLESRHEDYMIHSDIDMYFRGDLRDLFKLVRNNDISIRFRLKSSEHRKVMGGLIGFKVNDKVLKFMERWIYYLDVVPIPKRKAGYGQTSFYLAYKDLRNKYRWGDIPIMYISPWMKSDDKIWSANTTKGKTENLKICYADFEKLRNKKV